MVRDAANGPKLMSDSPHTNRLATETSPYLQQHAHNPVDWHPWDAQALDLARREDRPIFLSVGYSTCYWCHVMERECFENETISAQMNRAFINIKVDREERPDIDQLYMLAVQVLSRQGGWPMSVFLTPDLEPFFGGTYFPPADHYGRPGFPRVLSAVEEAFRQKRHDVNESAGQVTAVLRRLSRPQPSLSAFKIDSNWVKNLIDRSTSDFDEEHGGFGSAPKFPRQTLLELMLMYLRRHEDRELKPMLMRSLDAMAYGGIRDHLGGGFHRYSTDARWLVPHFEIMLYDNAMLLWIYAEAHRQTGEARYAALARGIADFVLRELTADSGAFYTALDAEVDGREGDNYLWTRTQIVEALSGKADAEKFCRTYGLDDGPNFMDPHQGNLAPDRNVLYLDEPDKGSALADKDLERARRILYDLRRSRKQPRLDNKILTSWNALMIRGLAHAGTILNEPKYLHAAEACADYLLQRRRNPENQLRFLDEYAFLIQALLALPGSHRVEQAKDLADAMRNKFLNESDGGFFYTEAGAKDLIVRQMVGSDSPLPSGNGVAAMVLLELGDVETARSTIAAFAGQMESNGESMSALVQAALLFTSAHGEISIAAGPSVDRPQSPAELAAKVIGIETKWEGSILRVHCMLAAGYHLNPHDAAEHPTRLTVTGAEIAAINYPPGELLGDFEILVRFKSRPESAFALNLSYQACEESACLPPATRTIQIPARN
jgi:uncharacterized protein